MFIILRKSSLLNPHLYCCYNQVFVSNVYFLSYKKHWWYHNCIINCNNLSAYLSLYESISVHDCTMSEKMVGMTILTHIKFFIDLNTPISKVLKSKVLHSMSFSFLKRYCNWQIMMPWKAFIKLCTYVILYFVWITIGLVTCPWGNMTAQQLSKTQQERFYSNKSEPPLRILLHFKECKNIVSQMLLQTPFITIYREQCPNSKDPLLIFYIQVNYLKVLSLILKIYMYLSCW